MDATGAGTSTGESTEPADVTGSAGDVTTGPSRLPGPADATGPLPVQAPTDPTGPLPTPQDGSWFAAGDDTAAQPAVAPTPTAPPPSWFATGPLPVIPTAPNGAAPNGAPPPDAATPPAGEVPPAAATGTPAALFDTSDAGRAPSAPPAGLFEPASGQPSATAPGPDLATPAPPPPTGVVPVVGPPARAGDSAPPTSAFPITPPPRAGGPVDAASPTGAFSSTPPPDGAADDPPAATGPIPVTPPAPATGAMPAQPASGDPAGFFAPAAPPSGPGVPPAGLFTPVAPPAGPASPAAPAPATGLFAAVAPLPAAAPPAPTAVPPDAPLRPADATGPMPVISEVVAPAPAGPLDVAPLPTRPVGGNLQPPPAPQAPSGTGSWAFGPEPTRPPRTDSWSFTSDDRRRGAAQSWPLPTPAGRGHPTGVTTVVGTGTAAKPTKRQAWPLTVVGVLVAVAAGIALVFSVARTNPADLATSAATEAGSWPGAHYQGAVAALDGGEIRFDLTVTADGASGTLSRDGGRATADLLRDQAGTLIRANREWWLYHHPTRADDLAGSWVAEPLTETQEIDPVLGLNATALAGYVRGEQPAQWQALEQQLVEGRSGIVLSDGARRVVVGSEDAHPLLAVDVAPNAATPPVSASRPTDEELAAVTGAAARVRQEAAPKSLAQLLQERPNVGIQLQPDPLCTAQTCNVTVTVTNTGTAPARGRLEVSADGQVVANHPLDVQPGQVATFTAGAPNPQFAQPGAAGRILWETRAVDD